MRYNLWEEAVKTVDAKWQEQLTALTDLSCGPTKLLEGLARQQKLCQAREWKCYNLSRQKVHVREILERVAFWLEKVQQVGDVIVQFDPVHAALPWAGARFLLMSATSDINKYGAMLESVQIVVSAISRYALIERIYCENVTSDAALQLQNNIILVYSAILVFLCKAKKYFQQNSAQRIALSLIQLGTDSDALTHDIEVGDAAVERIRPIVDGERTLSTINGVENLLDKVHDLRLDGQLLRHILLDLENPIIRIHRQLECIQDGLDREERRKILRWLSIEQYNAHHKVISRNRLPGSGSWLFKKIEYRRWRSTSTSSLLWLHGDPGAGKSVLVSLVIDEILKQLEEPLCPSVIDESSKEREQPLSPPLLAYFYCTRETSEPRRADPTEIASSILRQLSCKNDQFPIPSPVAAKWLERQGQGYEDRLDLSECIDLIIELTRESPAIIVIDALDECQKKTRLDLLDGLDKIIQDAEHVVKIFVSSRRDSDIWNHFRTTPRLEIAAADNSEDIENFVNSEVNKKIAAGKLLDGQPPETLVAVIKSTLLKRAEGIFRWVSASIQTLCDPSMQFEDDVRLALGRMPPDLKGVYAIIISQIHHGGRWSTPLAMKALKWLLCAKQPLYSDEFINALAIDLECSNSTITVESLLSICCNLVKYDTELDVFRFIHLSVREYLEEKEPDYQKLLSHSAIAIACLRCCLTGLKPKRKARSPTSQNKTFYDYAHVYWPVHCELSGQCRQLGILGKLLNDFLFPGGKPTRKFCDWVSLWTESWDEMALNELGEDKQLYDKLSDCDNWPLNVVGVACAFGFIEIIRGRCKTGGIRDVTFYGRKPFEIAIRHGHQDLVELLASATSSRQQTVNETALTAAVSMNQKRIASFLLNANPLLSVTDEVIEAAVANADIETMEFLLERIGHLEVTSEHICLAVGNESGGEQMVKLLLRLHGDVQITDEVIEEACKNRQHGPSIIESILEDNEDDIITEDAVEAAARNTRHGLAIITALFRKAGHLDVTREMIEAAAQNPSLEPLRWLLTRNVGETSISYESLRMAAGNIDVGDQMMSLLLEKCRIDLVDEDLVLAAIGNRKRAVELTEVLLSRAGPIALSTEVFEAAAENKYHGEALLEELFKHTGEIKLPSSVGVAAARNCYSPLEVLRMLLQREGRHEITTETLNAAAENPQYALELLEFIFTHGETKMGSIVLEKAAANEQCGLDVARFLWSHGNIRPTARAVEVAALNRICGDKMIALWQSSESLDVSSTAVEATMINLSLGPEIFRLLLRNMSVEITSEALRRAGRNPMCGLKLIEMVLKRKTRITLPEDILAIAATNYELGVDMLKLLLADPRAEPITHEAVEAVVGAPYIDPAAIGVLLSATGPSSVTSDVVQYALLLGNEIKAVIKALIDKNPKVVVTTEAVEGLFSCAATNDPVEMFNYLKECGKDAPITEMMVKGAIQGESSTPSIMKFLVDQCCEKGTTLPITEEVVSAAFRSRGSGGPATCEMLLGMLKQQGRSMTVNGQLVAAAASGDRAVRMLKILSDYHCRALPITLEVMKKAVGNAAAGTAVLSLLLDMAPEQIQGLCNAEEVLIEAVRNDRRYASVLRFLARNAPGRTLQITSKVLQAAAKTRKQALKYLLKILHNQNERHFITSLVTEDVVVSAAPYTSNLRLLYTTVRELGQKLNITTEAVKSAARAEGSFEGKECDRSRLRLIVRIVRQQNQTNLLTTLITEDVLVELAKSCDPIPALKLLQEVLGNRNFEELMSEAVIVAAGNADYSDSKVNYVYSMMSAKHEKGYYMAVTQLQEAIDWQNVPEMRALLDNPALPKGDKEWGFSPLSYACGGRFRRRGGFFFSVRFLLQYPEIHRNTVDDDGRTPLALATLQGHRNIVQLLLDHGADKTIRDKDGKTAEELAMDAWDYTLARMIRDHGSESQPKEDSKADDVNIAEMEKLWLRKSGTF